jgi:hypothetical protein
MCSSNYLTRIKETKSVEESTIQLEGAAEHVESDCLAAMSKWTVFDSKEFLI